MTRLVGFLLAAVALSEPLTARSIPASEVTDWLDWDLTRILAMSAGPDGAEIFPLWDWEDGEVDLGGILLKVDVEVDLGFTFPALLEVYLNPDDLAVRSVSFEPEKSLSLETIEEYFGTSPEIRLCRFAEVEIPLDSYLVPTDEDGEGVVTLAVFPSLRLIAEMGEEDGSVTRLRWVGRGPTIEGCP